MVSYANNELISSTDISKRFGTYLNQVVTHAVDKLAVLKNNKVEAVIISKDEYERMTNALEYLEDQELLALIEKRTAKPYKTLSEDEMLKELGIDKSELD
jgi:PHD/YefM family antitoxin component YafN of YafNO toxin-antitoxin module